tara:strand:+ start:5530 stop:6813 length:1284 start_codon:yes stop_codon:yes gene_type:complete
MVDKILTEEQKEYYVENNQDIEDYLASTGVVTRDAEGNLTQEAKDFGQAHFNEFGAREIGLQNPNRAGIEPPPPPPELNLSASDLAKIRATQGGGGSVTNITGPTQAEMIEAFRQAQDTSGIMSAIGTPTAGVDTPATGLYQPLEGLQAQVGQQATDTQAATGLFKPLTNIQTQIGTAGQPGTTDDEAVAPTGLFAGQAGIMSRVGQAGTASAPATGLFAGQAGLAGTQQQLQEQQQQIGTGVTGLQETIGQAAGVADDGVTPTAPTGLFAGQAGIMTGQERLGRDIGRDLSGLGGDIAAFRTAQQAYQRQAETARGDIQGTQRAGQRELERQIGSANIASNRAAEMLTQQRQAEAQAARMRAATQPTGIQQQAQSFAQTAGRNLALPTQQQQQNVTALGPMSQDPRDVFIRNLFRTSQGLMNRVPV